MIKEISEGQQKKRHCNHCSVCCVIANVTEGSFSKPACVACPLLNKNGVGCSVFGKKERPKMCSTFECAWLRGFGNNQDSPDRNGVMVTTNQINGGRWIMVMDYKKNAHKTTGKNIILDIANKIDLPVIVVDYDNLEKGKGDYVLIKESLKPKSSKIMGEFLEKYSNNIEKYKLVISKT